MPIKTCVGVVLYDSQNRIFLMTSPKWHGWVVPGGKIEPNETEEQALHREIKEELGIQITHLYRAGESIKPAGNDFYNPTLEFHFKDYFAQALSTQITPNSEIKEYGWFTLENAMNLHLVDSTRNLLLQFQDYLQSPHSRNL